MMVGGERVLEFTMLDQSSHFTGRGTTLVREVQMCLSVFNLLLRKLNAALPPDGTCFLLDHLKSCQQGHRNNIYSRLGDYLHCGFFPQITTLAIRVLESIFQTVPISFHAHLSKTDETIHQMFTLRLLAEDEYPHLRTAIIDLVSTCIKTGSQSQLMEIFFFDNNKNNRLKSDSPEAASNKGFSPILDYFLGVVQSPSQAKRLDCHKMATATDVKYSHAKELWNKLSASYIQISPEEVDLELENAREQFQRGFLILKEANVDGITELKDKSGGYGELLETISNMTGLDSKMSKTILKNYLMYDFRGAGATIMDYMNNPELKKMLLTDMWLCYLKERLFILHCMKLVWVYSNTDGHPYQLQEFGYYPGLPCRLLEKRPLYQFLAISQIAVLIHLFMQAPDIIIDSESRSAFESLKYLMSILEADKYQGLLLIAFDLSPLTPKDSPGYQTLINKAMEDENQFKYLNAMDLVDGIKCYTEKFTPAICMRIFNNYGSAQALKHSVCDGLIEISRETVGGVSHVMFSASNVPLHTACFLDCIKSVLQAGQAGDPKMSATIREAFELAECLCRQKHNPQVELLATIMEIMTAVAQTHCESVCLSASSTNIIPYSKILPDSTPTVMDTIEYGLVNFILTHSRCEGPFLQNYLNFLLEIIKHPDVPAGVVGAGINVVITNVFPQHVRWEYKKAEDRDEIGLLCLKLCHALLSPVVETPKIPDLQKLCIECLLMPSATSMLIDIALTGQH
ncbi:hypothetical protein B566_EDAN007308 [Ephemera danica]|nr:hypothetical protein B566_EDAN007308 [Ephemera danica]